MTSTTPEPLPAVVEDLLVGISQALTAMRDNLHLVETLTDSRKPAVLGFVTHEGKLAADRLLRQERRDRREALQHGRPTGSGDVPAAGNIAALSLAADFHMTLQHALRRTLKAITKGRPEFLRDVRALGVLTERQQGIATALEDYALAVNLGPTTAELVDHLRHLTWWVTQPSTLREVLDDLEHLNTTAEQFLDGIDRKELHSPCPHCGNQTLVVYLEAGVVHCGKDRHTGHFEPCTCPDPMCECKANPHYRHEWYRDLGTAPNGWWKLADRINLIAT